MLHTWPRLVKWSRSEAWRSEFKQGGVAIALAMATQEQARQPGTPILIAQRTNSRPATCNALGGATQQQGTQIAVPWDDSMGCLRCVGRMWKFNQPLKQPIEPSNFYVLIFIGYLSPRNPTE